jgi:DNA polymerase III epsilon subunit-like protein
MSLKDAAAANGIIYTAHDALSDAEACALLMIKDILKNN